MKDKDMMFTIEGYTKDYYLDGKYIGSIQLETPDRETMGYYGRRMEVLEETVHFSKSKKIVKGKEVKTELQMICGRYIKK